MRVRISNVRGTYLYLNQKQQPSADILRDNPNAKARHAGSFILEPDSKVVEIIQGPPKQFKPTTMEAVELAVAAEKWKEKGKTFLDSLEKNRKCYRDGNKQLNKSGDVSEGFAGRKFVVAKSDDQPKLFGQVPNEPITNPADIGRIFAWGNYYDIVVDIYATEKGSKGVFADLLIVQYRKKGEPLGGGPEAGGDDLETLPADEDGEDLL